MNAYRCTKIFAKANLIAVLSIYTLGCSNTSEQENATYVVLNTSLLNSSQVIDDHNSSIMHAITEKVKDYETRTSAERWYPKAVTVNRITSSLCSYINNFRTQFEIESGIRIKEGKKLYDNLDETISKKFYEKGLYKEFEQRLFIFQDSMNNIDRELTKILYENGLSSFVLDTALRTTFYDNFFKDKPALATIAILTSFENYAKQLESFALDFCNRKCPEGGDYYTQYLAIATQDKSYVKGGDKIEISAGVGNFSIQANPRILINDRDIKLNAEGVAIYKFKASKVAGKHYIPLSVEFTKPDSQRVKMEKTIEYTVAD